MFGNIGMPEILIILAIVAVLFGPSQLPKLGRSMGETIREFRGVGKELQRGHDDDDDARTE